MRLAGHTYVYRDVPLADALDQLQALGFEEVEVWLGHVSDAPAQTARELRARGLRVAAVSAGGFYEQWDPSVERAFAAADALGSPLLVACVRPDLLPGIERAAPSGVRICVENHWDQPLATAAEVRRALDSATSALACLDTGHALLSGIRPERFAHDLGSSLGHVHLKDARMPSRPERLLGRRVRRRFLRRPTPVLPGHGHLDLVRFASALKGQAYAGTVTLEYEGSEPTRALGALLGDAKAAFQGR